MLVERTTSTADCHASPTPLTSIRTTVVNCHRDIPSDTVHRSLTTCGRGAAPPHRRLRPPPRSAPPPPLGRPTAGGSAGSQDRAPYARLVTAKSYHN
jgi:hypothetical protein